MPQHFRVEQLLTPADLDALKDWLREKNLTRSIDDTHDWILAKGYTLGRTAVWNWVDAFRIGEETRRAGEFSAAYLSAMKESGGELAVADAAVLQTAQLISQMLMEKRLSGEIDESAVSAACLQLQRLSLAKQRIEKTRTEFEQREKRAVEAAAKVAHEGGDGEAVVNKVRQILGL